MNNASGIIYARIRSTLREQKQNQEWLAAQVGVTRTTLGRWLRGERQMPLDAVFTITNALGIELSSLTTNMTKSNNPVLNVLPDPDQVGQTEYRIVYELIKDIVDNNDKDFELELITTSLAELESWSRSCRHLIDTHVLA